MKKINLIFIFLFLFLSASQISAQTDVGNPTAPGNFAPPPPQREFSLLRDLNLSPEQIQQIRRINQGMRFQRQNAVRNFEEAKRKLDESIYSDTSDEETIQANLRNLIQAQAELTKLRTQSELAVRKVLTPEQLVKFREIRRNFAERQNMRQNRRERNKNRRRPGENRQP